MCQTVVRIDGQSARGPFLGAIKLAKRRETHGSQVGGSRVFRMQHELPLSAYDTFPRCRLHVLLAPERSENTRQYQQGLIVVRLDVGGALEKSGRFVKLALGEAGAGIEVMGFKQIGIQGDCLIEFRHRLRISLAKRQGQATRGMRFGESAL